MTATAIHRPAGAQQWASMAMSCMARTTGRAICAVRLIDRRTGLAHAIGGIPLVIYTRDPAGTAAEMLARRDPGRWEVRIDNLVTEGGQ